MDEPNTEANPIIIIDGRPNASGIANETIVIEPALVTSSTGAISLNDFSRLESEAKELNMLKNLGLTPNDIKIYNDYKKGRSYLDQVHKNMESDALDKAIKIVLEKIERTNDSDTKSLDAGSAQKKEYSIDPSFLIKQHAVPSSSHQSHPINHLDELNDDLFGHMDVDKLPSANKRRKILRRMERKFAKTIPIPEPVKESVSNLNCQPSHYFNEFIKSYSNTKGSDNLTELAGRNPGSKWDIKDMSTYKTVVNESKHQKKSGEIGTKLVGCKPETLYTVKDNRIVRLQKKSIVNVAGNSGKLRECYETVEIMLPINKAEEKLLEGSRLSLEDIKKIPKFENYDPGECSKSLYIKNLSNNLKVEDLQLLFNRYDRDVKVTIMVGRMRGQAFVTFTSAETATLAMNERNGTILKGKPIIVLYGKGPKTQEVLCES